MGLSKSGTDFTNSQRIIAFTLRAWLWRKRPSVLLVALIQFAVSTHAEKLPNPLSRWTWINPDPQGFALNGVTYADGRFVAVGGANTIITSINGRDWRVVRSNKIGDLYGITFGNGRYVAVGSGENLVVSDDGENWESRPSGTSNTLFSITYANGTFVAVGGRTSIVTSTNGLDWVVRLTNPQADPLLDNFYGVTFGNGIFLASGPESGIATSLDALDWAWQPAYCSYIGTAYFSENQFFYTGGYFIVNGNEWYWTGGMVSSSDGTNWTRVSVPYGIAFRSMARGANGVVGVADYSSGLQFSTNFVDWTILTNGPTDGLVGVSFGNGCFVAVGDNGAIYRSSDGIHWSSQMRAFGSFRGGIFTEMGFLLVGDPPSSVCTSADGVNWLSHNLNASLNAVAAGTDIYVAVGRGGTIYMSKDAALWSPAASPTAANISAVAYGNGLFLALAGTGIGRLATVLAATLFTPWHSGTGFF